MKKETTSTEAGNELASWVSAVDCMVWAVLMDFPAYSEGNPFVRYLEGSAETGSRLHVTVKSEGDRVICFAAEVLASVPEWAFRWRSMMGGMRHVYRHDLAYIHDAGFGHLAANAAPFVIEELQRTGTHGGTVVDLGCGSGIAARVFRDAGYNVVGIDLSEALIKMARTRVPDAAFRVESFVTADIPPCVAVTAIGEVFNYTFDSASKDTTIRANLFGRIYAALAPGGLFVFDIAGHARAPSHNPQRTFAEGSDWAVHVEAEADPANSLLTRRITTFLKVGELYHRDAEVHQLQLFEPIEVVELLRSIGFSVQTFDCYGSLPLPQGLVGVLASKPGGVGA